MDDDQLREQLEKKVSLGKGIRGTWYFFYYLTIGYFTHPEQHRIVKRLWELA